MGWNTTLVLYNDRLDELERPGSGERILKAVRGLSERDYLRHAYPGSDPLRPDLHNHLTNFGFGLAVEQHHADETAVVYVGGNYGDRVHLTFGYRFNEDAMRLRILEEQASKLGYTLVKKPGRRQP